MKSPQKRQGPTPVRGHSKKRHQIDFATSDKEGEDYDADSSGGSTIILHQRSGSSSDDSLTSCKWKQNFCYNMKVSNITIALDIMIYFVH